MNKKFVVVSLAISGKGNKIFKTGEEVKEGQTNVDLEQLVKEGHVEVVDNEVEAVDNEVSASVQAGATASNDAETDVTASNDAPVLFTIKDAASNEKEVRSIADLGIKEIKAELKAREIQIPVAADKDSLFELLVNSL